MKNSQNSSRRSFIRTTAKGALAAAVAPSLIKKEIPVPEDMFEEVAEWRHKLIEGVVEEVGNRLPVTGCWLPICCTLNKNILIRNLKSEIRNIEINHKL